jgi:hypothetical protein
LKKLALVVAALLALSGSSWRNASTEMMRRPQEDACPSQRQIIEIRDADPAKDMAHHNAMRDLFVQKAAEPNTTILLGPAVVLDFSPVQDLPVRIARCVTIRSVSRFENRGDVRDRSDTRERGRLRAPIPDARSSTAPGPLLKFGKHRSSGDKTFLEMSCAVGTDDQADHIRLSGFRVFGPSMGQQSVGDHGILISKCVDIEISNMEIAGWGGEGIRVKDDANEYPRPEVLAEAWQLRRIPGVCQEPPWNGPNGRIGSPSQVRIVNNFIHNNQQPSHDGHAGGYGVQVTDGAHAQIDRNLFSTNRHSIEGGGTMGGYEATHNLVLRYGGIHWDSPVTVHTHAFDIHGTGDNGFGGFAGARTLYSYNAFQYDADQAIYIRGSPRCGVEISHNVFPHHGLEHDWGADAVKLYYRQDLEVVKLGPSNTLDYNSYGKYGVCDFDGDGVDDLFLATGISWWFSGMGEMPWRFLSERNERIEKVRFGYFDGDNKCDVVTEGNGEWAMSSGGVGLPRRLGSVYAPFSEVAFGRFDLSQTDRRAGATKQTTQAFWRSGNGQWKVANLTGVDQGWRNLGSSSFPMSALRFGDFNADGVTDVLAVENGRWAISSGGANPWERLNNNLSDDVRNLYIADVNNNNVDDLLRVKRTILRINQFESRESIEWSISYDGRQPWRMLKTFSWTIPTLLLNKDPALHAFAGRFGVAPGSGVLAVDRGGFGHFYAPLESQRGASPDWNSTFAY